MKKALVLLVLALIVLLYFVSCDFGETQDPTPEHTHDFGEWSTTKNATCTVDGVKTRHCDCGEKQSDTIPAAGHEEQILPAKNATCTETGLTEGIKCKTCGEILTAQQTIPLTAHTYYNENDEECNVCGYKRDVECAHAQTEIIPGKQATCTTIGVTDGAKCKKCGEIITAQTAIDIKPHTEENDKAVEPTCTTTGLTQGKHCSVCGIVLLAQDAIPMLNHTYVAIVTQPTCTGGGYTTHRCICGEYYISDYTFPFGHSLTETPAVEATCAKTGLTAGTHCSRCGVTGVAQEVVYAIGHNYQEWVIIKEPTLAEEGLKESTCACGMRHTRFFGYHGDYGYNSLASLPNGDKMQLLYNEIDKVAIEFHSNTSLNAENNVVGEFNYSILGLASDEAIAVWKVYKNDHPLFYWISNTVSYDSTDLILLTDDIYAEGSDRAAYNEIVYDGIKEYAGEVSKKEGSPYLIALAFHDKIILSMEYAYEADGITPENDAWAHNILGVFEKKAGVCEAYARTFQLLLNYCGVENIFVTGKSGEDDHAWNLAKMDDGSWYWFDLTYDDKSDTNSNTLDWTWGIWYKYFCVNDTKNVAPPYSSYNCSFIDDHTPETPYGTGTDFLYPLPLRSENETITKQYYALSQTQSLPYQHSFTVNGILYNVAGYNVALVAEISLSGKVAIPETVTYNGRTYEVIAIYYLGNKVTSITIPKTVKYVHGALNGRKNLTEFIVDKDNPYFTAKDGVLFTKNLYTLISYPFANPRTEYIIPDEVHDIAKDAFGNPQSDDDDSCLYLSTLIVGANVEGVGRNNDGWGYRDKEIVLEEGEIFDDLVGYTMGYWPSIYKSLKDGKKIKISDSNPHYFIEEGVLYSGNWIQCVLDQTITSLHIGENISEIPSAVFREAPLLETITVDPNNKWLFAYDNVLYRGSIGDASELVGVPRAIKGNVSIIDGVSQIPQLAFSDCTHLVSVTIPESVKTIGFGAFEGCTSLTSVTLPNSVTSIGSSAFSHCNSLTSISLPDSITVISSFTFYNCTALANIQIPNSVTYIESSALSDCTSLKNVTIPNGVTSIGGHAFYRCSSLESIIIPKSLTNIDIWAFYGCSSMTSIIYKGTKTEWNAVNKGESWNHFTGNYTIYCTDGLIAK